MGCLLLLLSRAYATMAAYIAKAIGASIRIPSYRRAPEHTYPLPTRTRSPRSARQRRSCPVIVAGDQPAGNSTRDRDRVRDAGEPVPAGMLLMSPWWT